MGRFPNGLIEPFTWGPPKVEQTLMGDYDVSYRAKPGHIFSRPSLMGSATQHKNVNRAQ